MAGDWRDGDIGTEDLVDRGERLLADSHRLLGDLERRVAATQRGLGELGTQTKRVQDSPRDR